MSILYDKDGYVNVSPSANAGFDTQIELFIPQVHGSSFTVIDYASAGKTWREDSRYGCRMKTRP